MTRASFGRHTGPLITDPAKTAALEARNALIQFDEVRRLIPERLHNLQLRPEDICALQALAVAEIWEHAGIYRPNPIGISNTEHEPPEPSEVPRLVAEMCDYANSVPATPENAIHIASYLMWRHNWIHPFQDGNGRTSRAVSYLALCSALGMELPGIVTVPDLIVRNKNPYYHALDAADAAWKEGRVDVSQMEGLMTKLLIEQLETA